ncbi:MAG: DUF5123 domain-containing protein [Chitinophagaceae bacterium]
MKRTNYNIIKIFIPVLCCAIAGVISCKKNNESLEAMRRFMPSGDIKSTSGETNVFLYWNASLYTSSTDTTVKYRIQVSKDSLFNTVERTYQRDTTGITITDDDLVVRQKYYARVKTLGADTTLDSKWLRSSSFTITGEQIFLTIADGDLLDNAALLKWKATAGLTKITITPAGGSATDIALTSTDITASQKLIQSLQGGTTYTAEIFLGTKSKGIITFTTKSPITGDIIDLRGITGRPSVLADTLPQIAAGSVVLLKRGQTYEIATSMNLSKTVTIMSGYDFSNELARINMTGNFNVTASSVIDSIVFSSVKLVGAAYASSYVFNISNACTVKKMVFDGCQTEIFRGVVRLQTAVINMTDFKMNNCIADSISNYGIINVDNVNCKIDNISITNSTIYKTEKIVTSKQNSVAVTIQNCTINEAPWGGGSNYLIDYGSTATTNNVTSGVIVSNCIMGIGKNNAGNTAVRGIRVNATTAVTSTGNYNTSDYVPFATGAGVPSMTAYSGTSFALWQDPSNGNFAFKDASFAGKSTSGDPRWRQ